jgi:hypothetical protein
MTAWYAAPGRYQPFNILVAGMKASTTYHMRSVLQCEGKTLTSADATFTTGPLPSIPFPSIQVTRPNPNPSGENPGIELVNVFVPNTNEIEGYFTDRDGNPIWYYDVGAADGDAPYTMKLLPNGNIIFSITRSVTAGTVLREVDLAGNTVREMGTAELDAKMQAAGFDFVPTGFHHDIFPLPNGHLIVLTNFYQNFTDAAGYPGTTQVLVDGIVDLDPEWNPVWAWSAADHLDIDRHPFGLPDWTHGNAVIYSPADGNLLFSSRAQSWVMKIDYSNGTGDGNILWKLGYQGDFTLAQGSDPSLWFYAQHFPSLVSQNGQQTDLTVWDNGNNRVLDMNGTLCTTNCYSRATHFQLDEGTMVANLVWTDSPGYFSFWGGSINQLANGNVEFDLNAPSVPPAPNIAAEVQEVTQTPIPQILWQMDFSSPSTAYRAYRVPSLYPGVTWAY